MQRAIQTAGALALMIATTGAANAQDAGQNPAGPRIIGTHHIDRFEAIRQVRAELQANPNQLNDWIILGELAQEVAPDVPANLAPGYYKLAHEAYESALKLAPNNTSL